MNKSAFKTMKKSPRVLDLQKLTQPKHATLNIVRGFKQSKPSSLRTQQSVTFRPISPQSQPQLMQQPSQGSVIQQPQSQQELALQMQGMSINPPSPTSSEEELSKFTN
tara:strand:+ start:150 stop:473 length:324 start_codon:yes stop_codon:yes gene_type:complete